MKKILDRLKNGVTNLVSFQKYISRVILVSSVSSFGFALIVSIAMYIFYERNKEFSDNELIKNANIVLQSNIVGKINVIANNKDFFDFLHFGVVSRRENYDNILWLFSSVDRRLVSAISVDDFHGNKLFFNGTKSDFYATYQLCYLSKNIDFKYGVCDYQLTLYFNNKTYISYLNEINRNIQPCNESSCIRFYPFAAEVRDKFNIIQYSNLAINVKYQQDNFKTFIILVLLLAIAIIILMLISERKIQKLIKSHLVKPIEDLQVKIRSGKGLNNSQENQLSELSYLFNSFKKHQNEVANIKMGKMVTQVAHDIRSPLATINAIVKETHEIEEQKRIILRNATQQLNDIANVLLVKYRSKDDGNKSENSSIKDSEVIAVLLDLIVSEKRLEYKSLPITIVFDVEMSARGAFAQIVVSDFKRVISNIINNAIEAINGKGQVKITLSTFGSEVNIEISDTGVGMPSELIAKVFDGSIISNKKEGSGIGLVSAYQLIKSWGGDLKIESQLDAGTTIRLSFVLLEPAPWFAANLNFVEGSKVVVLDDDQSIHDLWNSRFDCEISSAHLQLQHFYQADELMRTDKREFESAYFLCDYELIGQDKTGLDVIEQMNLGNSAMLVTSRYDDRDIRRRCAELNIKILPKNYAAYVPICITEKKSDDSLIIDNQPDLILIDDDYLIINTWKMIAKKKNKVILAFDNFPDAEKTIEKLSRTIPIYIDSNLGAKISGEECAKILYEKGFVNIYLATGHHASRFKSMEWIKGIVGKEPPF